MSILDTMPKEIQKQVRLKMLRKQARVIKDDIALTKLNLRVLKNDLKRVKENIKEVKQ